MRHTPVALLLILFATSAAAQPAIPGPPPFPPAAPMQPTEPQPTEPQPTQPQPEESGPPPIDRNLPLHKQIDECIARGVKALLDRQRADGAWAEGMEMDDDPGRTALAGMALLSCGVSHQSPELVKATQFLKQSKIEGRNVTYNYALRAAYFAQLPEAQRKLELKQDVAWLQKAIIDSGERKGMYTYRAVQGGSRDWGHFSGDFSNSQYGVLGVWYGAIAGLEVPSPYWTIVENCWRNGQNDDGGWGYRMKFGGSYASMTAAGAATLYVTYDYLHAQQELDLEKQREHQKQLENAMRWLGEHFAVDHNPGKNDPGFFGPRQDDPLNNIFAQRRARQIGVWVQYMLFGFERVGEASGLTRFGTHKWFEEGAQFLIDTQNTSGTWNLSGFDGADPSERTVGTAYALLFLSRGRSPVAMQKLQLKTKWNNRSRDCAAVVRWITRQTERHTNWQIVPVEASAAEMREAPILYVASNQAIALRDAEKQRIKTCIDQGAVLLAVNEGPNKDFAGSIERLAKELYPQYTFRDLAPNHLIYTENFAVTALSVAPRGLSNGVRELMILFPGGDMSWKLQQGAGNPNPASKAAFGLVGNLYIYMNDKANPRFKGDDTWIDADPAKEDKREIAVARLKHGGNWNPEPLGWSRLANVLHNNDAIKLAISEVDPEISNFAPSTALVHLTAADSFKLSQVQQDVLKRWLDAGGVLFFDAAGGSSYAQLSFEMLLGRMYPGERLKTLPIDHPIYSGARTGGAEIKQAAYRRFALDRIARTTLPRLKVLEINNRIVAVASSEDLSAGLVGFNIDGIVGYSPASSTELTRNLLLWAATRR